MPKKNDKLFARLKRKDTIINFKTSTDQNDLIEGLSCKYMDGNKSEWIRFASTYFKPTHKQLRDYKEQSI